MRRIPGQNFGGFSILTIAADFECFRFTVAICTWNRASFLGETIAAVLAELTSHPQAQLLVIDNASTDGTAALLADLAARHPRLTVLREAKRGAYHAIVRAIGSATGDYLIFVDDDAMPEPGCFTILLRELREYPSVGYVGATIVAHWDGARPAWMGARALREVPIITWPMGRTLCAYPAYPPSVVVALRRAPCLALFATPERQRIELGWGGGKSSGLSTVGGDDHDLAEIYIRNGYQVIAQGDARVRHRVVAEKLSPTWLIEKFASEGRLRIRFARLANYSVVSRHTIPILLAMPVLLLLRPSAFLLPSRLGVLLRAYCAKAVGAWRELLTGPRGIRFDYALADSSLLATDDRMPEPAKR